MSIKGPDISKSELLRLIQGCIARDRNCQKQLYELYSGTLFSLCLRYAGNQEEAEEILQDGFVQVFLYIHQFKHTGSFEGWMRRIFINCALRCFRENEKKIKVLPLMEDNQTHADISISNRIFEKEIIRVIQMLPPVYRMVFNLYALEGFKHREIAALLHISEGTSKSNLFDARNILKKYLRQEYKIAK
jgi:RNA polymerase sigma factor (sigma-70 family)